MKQIVSLIKDNQAHFALVDEDDGSIIPFADLLIPDPDRFGLHQSALLGTNLISALGLNGHKHPKVRIPRVGDELVPQLRGEQPAEQLALDAPADKPVKETARERRNRLAREHYARKRGKAGRPTTGQRQARRPDNKARRYISMDEVMAVVNQYPEGIRLRDVAERIWRQTEGKGSDEPLPQWVYTACSNRLTNARKVLAEKGTPLPYREEDRPILDASGEFNGMTGKWLLPLAAKPSPPIPFST